MMSQNKISPASVKEPMTPRVLCLLAAISNCLRTKKSMDQQSSGKIDKKVNESQTSIFYHFNYCSMESFPSICSNCQGPWAIMGFKRNKLGFLEMIHQTILASVLTIFQVNVALPFHAINLSGQPKTSDI